jgi:hypothetical protein
MFTSDRPDPWDEEILVNVKEAAWMLSLPEHAIRQAVTSGDVDRVLIGAGTVVQREQLVVVALVEGDVLGGPVHGPVHGSSWLAWVREK